MHALTSECVHLAGEIMQYVHYSELNSECINLISKETISKKACSPVDMFKGCAGEPEALIMRETFLVLYQVV